MFRRIRGLSPFSSQTNHRRRSQAQRFAAEGLEDRLLLAATQNVEAVASTTQVEAGDTFTIDANYSTIDPVACPSSQYHGYESQFGLRVTAGVGQFSASGAHAKEAENCRANSTGVWSPSELCGRR